MRTTRSNGLRGFTLVELLVVIAIISLLAAMLLPVLGKALSVSRAASCTSNMRQINLWFVEYAEDWDGVIPHNGGGGSYYTNYSATTWYVKANEYFGYRVDEGASILKCPQAQAAVGCRRFDRISTQIDYGQNLYLGGWNTAWTPDTVTKIEKLTSRAYVYSMGNKRGPHNWYLTNLGVTLYNTHAYVEFSPNLDGNPWSWDSAPSAHVSAPGHPGNTGNFMFGDGHTGFYSYRDSFSMTAADRNIFRGIGLVP